LPSVGQTLQASANCAVVESVKAASDIYAPVSGEIVAINDSLVASPELINAAPYDSWFFKIMPSSPTEIDTLLDANAYGAQIGN
jgi:glycine cleavage system H protein